MSVSINQACVACGACVWECPTGAIVPGDPRPSVRPEHCTECYGFFGESQCAVVCPADAVVVTEEPVELLRTRFELLRPGQQAQDVWIWRRSGPAAAAPPPPSDTVI